MPSKTPELPPARLGITMKQAKVLKFITDFIAEKGYSPSYAEMGRAMGISSKSSMHRVVQGLVDRGAIRKSRSPRSTMPLE